MKRWQKVAFIVVDVVMAPLVIAYILYYNRSRSDKDWRAWRGEG